MFDYRIPAYFEHYYSENYSNLAQALLKRDVDQWKENFRQEFGTEIFINTRTKNPVNLLKENQNVELFRKVKLDQEPFVYPIHVDWQFANEILYAKQDYNGYFNTFLKISDDALDRISKHQGIVFLYNCWEAWSAEIWNKIIDHILSRHSQIKKEQVIVLCSNHNLKNADFTFIAGSLDLLDHNINLYEKSLNLIENVAIRKNKFICLNRAPKVNRFFALAKLTDYLDDGLLSFLGDMPTPNVLSHNDIDPKKFKTEWPKYIKEQMNNPNSQVSYNIKSFISDWNGYELTEKFIREDIKNKIPYLIDENFDPRINPNPDPDIDKFFESSLNIVTETYWRNGEPTFITEKTFKPIYFMQPFVIITTPYFLKNLHDLGYQTFSHWIDESYDNILDDYERCFSALNSAVKFFDRDRKNIAEDLKEMLPVLQHNYWHRNHLRSTDHVHMLTSLMWHTQYIIDRKQFK